MIAFLLFCGCTDTTSTTASAEMTSTTACADTTSTTAASETSTTTDPHDVITGSWISADDSSCILVLNDAHDFCLFYVERLDSSKTYYEYATFIEYALDGSYLLSGSSIQVSGTDEFGEYAEYTMQYSIDGNTLFLDGQAFERWGSPADSDSIVGIWNIFGGIMYILDVGHSSRCSGTQIVFFKDGTFATFDENEDVKESGTYAIVFDGAGLYMHTGGLYPEETFTVRMLGCNLMIVESRGWQYLFYRE